MKRNAKQSSRGSGSGSRLRLAVLAATVAAFFLVPAAAQAETGVETLKISITGSGSGRIYTPPKLEYYKGSPPMSCSYASPGPVTGVCEDLMSNEGEGWEQVHVVARAAPGSEFVEWKEENGEFENCNILNHETAACEPFVEPPGEFEETTKLGAVFNKEAGMPLTVNLEGQGTVVSSPAGIEECTNLEFETPRTCGKAYAANTEVTLTASPANKYAFASWVGCTSHAGLTCTVKMSAAKTVTATFTPAPPITIEKPNGAGSGKVKAVFSCQLDCTGGTVPAKPGSLVKVIATPGIGYKAVSFAGSEGPASACTVSPCEFTMGTEATKVRATFATISKAKLTVKLVGPAANKGKVSTSPIGISCTAGPCEITNAFPTATPVVITVPPPTTGYTFVGWKTGSGTCTGTTSPCEVTASGQTLEAEFK